MKTPLVAKGDRHARMIAADLSMQIDSLFVACPNLCGFVIEEHSGLHGDINAPDAVDRFVITEVSFRAPLSHEEADAACALIADVISELIATQPEATALLRGRTFARTLH